MAEKMIEIPMDLFLELVECKSRLKSIEVYTNGQKYSVDRGAIAQLAGFELEKKDSDE